MKSSSHKKMFLDRKNRPSKFDVSYTLRIKVAQTVNAKFAFCYVYVKSNSLKL